MNIETARNGSQSSNKGPVDWMEKVTEAKYRS